MVLFANFIALVEEYGGRVINFTFHSYAEFFRTTKRDIYCSYPPPVRQSWLDVFPGAAGVIRKTRVFYHAVRATSRLNEKFVPFGKAVVTLRDDNTAETIPLEDPCVENQIRMGHTVFVYGWRFRAPELVRRHADKIRAYFRPTEESEQVSRHAVAALRLNADLVVGVHIRRGDYRGWKDGQFFFETSHYADWMREMAALFPGRKIAFLVCSNEPRVQSEFPGLTVGFGPGTSVGDLYALAECDFILGPLSTFTQWASFYGNKPLFHLRDHNTRLELAHFQVSDLAEVP